MLLSEWSGRRGEPGLLSTSPAFSMSSASHSAGSSGWLAQKTGAGPTFQWAGKVDAICRSRSNRAKRPRAGCILRSLSTLSSVLSMPRRACVSHTVICIVHATIRMFIPNCQLYYPCHDTHVYLTLSSVLSMPRRACVSHTVICIVHATIRICIPHCQLYCPCHDTHLYPTLSAVLSMPRRACVSHTVICVVHATIRMCIPHCHLYCPCHDAHVYPTLSSVLSIAQCSLNFFSCSVGSRDGRQRTTRENGGRSRG